MDKYGIGIVQLPCPEEKELGIGRPVGDDTKQGYDTPSYRKTCYKIVDEIIDRIKDYHRNNYKVACIVGVDGSPSCGVTVTPIREKSGTVFSSEMGIFFETLSEKMEKMR